MGKCPLHPPKLELSKSRRLLAGLLLRGSGGVPGPGARPLQAAHPHGGGVRFSVSMLLSFKHFVGGYGFFVIKILSHVLGWPPRFFRRRPSRPGCHPPPRFFVSVVGVLFLFLARIWRFSVGSTLSPGNQLVRFNLLTLFVCMSESRKREHVDGSDWK